MPSAPSAVLRTFAMDVGRPTHRFASSVAFSFYRPDQIERISVKRIHNPVIFDQLNRPTDGGLYDLALGPLENSSRYAKFAFALKEI